MKNLPARPVNNYAEEAVSAAKLYSAGQISSERAMSSGGFRNFYELLVAVFTLGLPFPTHEAGLTRDGDILYREHSDMSDDLLSRLSGHEEFVADFFLRA
jgi:dihydroorotase